MRHTSLVAIILLVVHLPACTSYRMLADPATELQASPKPVRVARVTLRNGEKFVLEAPRVDGDSLRGTAENGEPHSLALADVSHVEARARSDSKTGLLVAGIFVAAILAVFAMPTINWILSGAT